MMLATRKTEELLSVCSAKIIFLSKDRHSSISGIVTDCKYKNVIPNVTVKLVGSDGSCIEATTRLDGSYLFDSTKININTQYVVTTQVGNNITTPSNKYGYINCSDKIKLSITTNSEKHTEANFCLPPREPCRIGVLPTIVFDKKQC